jgi:hypothetical protein
MEKSRPPVNACQPLSKQANPINTAPAAKTTNIAIVALNDQGMEWRRPHLGLTRHKFNQC